MSVKLFKITMTMYSTKDPRDADNYNRDPRTFEELAYAENDGHLFVYDSNVEQTDTAHVPEGVCSAFGIDPNKDNDFFFVNAMFNGSSCTVAEAPDINGINLEWNNAINTGLYDEVTIYSEVHGTLAKWVRGDK